MIAGILLLGGIAALATLVCALIIGSDPYGGGHLSDFLAVISIIGIIFGFFLVVKEDSNTISILNNFCPLENQTQIDGHFFAAVKNIRAISKTQNVFG